MLFMFRDMFLSVLRPNCSGLLLALASAFLCTGLISCGGNSSTNPQPPPPVGSIAFVQVNAATPQSPTSSVQVAYTAAETTGNLNIIAVGWSDTTSSVNTVSDSGGNTYVLAVGPTIGAGLQQSIYYAKSIAGGSNTVTVTFNQPAAFVDVRVLEYRGLDPNSPLDVTAGATGSGTSTDSGSATTTSAHELIFGAGTTGGTFGAAGTGFTSRVITSPDGDIAEDKVVSSSGSYNATAMTSSAIWVMQMVTFRASGQNPGPGGITVSLSPHLAAVTTSQSQPFTATISGGSATLIWFVDNIQGGNSSVGTIVSTGATTALYSPSASTTPGGHNITAQPSTGTISPASVVAVTDLDGVFTHHNDPARTGQNTKEYALTPATVSSGTFGKLFSCTLDSPGYVYAQPLYVANATMNDGKTHNVIFVATESDWVYAFDADSSSCQQFWRKSMLAAGETTVPAADTGETNDLTPEIGITSTPVIDINSKMIYVCAKSKDSSSNYHHRLHALNIASGTEPLSPVEITTSHFVPLFQLQRPALLLNNGTVYLAFGSHGDFNTYQGWLMGYDAAMLAQKFVWSSTDPTIGNNEGAIWQSGDGVAADSAGNVYVETGNGTFDANIGGINYSDSVVKLSSTASVLDFFTPSDQSTLSANDIDLGSSGVIILPDSVGSAAHSHLLLATGKTGILYLLDQTNLGKFNSGGNQDVQEVSVQPNTTQVHGGIFGQPAYWNGNLYTAAIADFLKQFTIANGAISVTAQSLSSNIYNLRGATPAVSANGTTGGIVWALDVGAYPSGPAVLNAYDATNVSNQLYSSPSGGTGVAGNAVKFAVPTVANGKVYVGTQGKLDVFGLLPN